MIALLLLSGCGVSVAEPTPPPPPPPPAVIDLAPIEAAPPPFTDRLVPFDAEREALSVAYLRDHYGLDATSARIEPRIVVLHWTATPTAESAWRVFEPTALAGRPELRRGGDLNVSAHFLVDRDGAAWRLVPETTMARHVIGLNHVAVGIENVGDGTRLPLTEAQVATNAAIVRWLAARHPLTHLVGHHETLAFVGHPYWAERDEAYRTAKIDPGDAFVDAVAARVADLGLERAPGR